MKHFKRAMSVFLTAAVGITMFGGLHVSAATDSGTVTGTMHFTDYHDVMFNGHSEGAAYMTMTTSGTTYTAYCIDLPHTTNDGISYTASTTYYAPDATYAALSSEEQTWLDYALMFGYNGSTTYSWSSYEATQCMLWTIVNGHFGGSAESSEEASIADGMLGTLANASAARSAYETIRANMVAYAQLSGKVPSFASSSAEGATQYVLNYNRNDQKFELSLTDTNNILQYFNFSATGVTVTRSGNVLTLSSDQPIASLSLSATSSLQPSDVLPGAQDGLPLYWICPGHQTLVSFDPSRGNTAATAYLNIKTQDVGSVRIVKKADDNIISGVRFDISQDGEVIATATTDSDGNATVENLPVGNYTVSEDNVPDRYVAPASQDVTVSTGGTTEVDFSNTLKPVVINPQPVPKSPAPTVVIPDNATPLASNPDTGDSRTDAPVLALTALAALAALSGCAAALIKRRRHS